MRSKLNEIQKKAFAGYLASLKSYGRCRLHGGDMAAATREVRNASAAWHAQKSRKVWLAYDGVKNTVAHT